MSTINSLVSEAVKAEIKDSVLKVTEYNIYDYSGPRVLVCGSREGFNEHALAEFIDEVSVDTIVIQGGAKGADIAAGRRAVQRGLHTVNVEADWERFGKFAGKYRNEAMAKMLRPQDRIVAFWDGKSSGTRHMIEHGRKMGFQVTVVGPDGDILAEHPRWEGESCPKCGAAKRGDIPECPVCHHKHHGEFYTLGEDIGVAEDDRVVDEAVGIALRNRCPECNADLEKADGPYCDCGALVVFNPEHDGRNSEHDSYTRVCDECGSDIVGGKCDCGAHHGDIVEQEPREEKPQFLGNALYLNQHAKDCRCEACRKKRLKAWQASGEYRRLYHTIGDSTCRCERCRKARFWERVHSGDYRREYRLVVLPR